MRPWRRAAALAVLVVAAAEVLRVVVGANFHVVAPGRCYRSGQLSPNHLQSVLHTHGVRTVINIRGNNVGRPWYDDEIELVERNGVRFAAPGMWTYSQPTPGDFHVLLQALDESPEPLLIHCQSGSDRTGLACALYLLLRTDADVATARGQMSLRFGHWRWGKAGCQDRVLDRYAIWLDEEGLRHEPAHLRRWARDVYQPEQ